MTPLPRRRPWKVARETVSLDHFSNGRLILGIGLGYAPEIEFEPFGEETDVHIRAKQLDESLEILQNLWSGNPFSFKGEYYEIKDVCFKPKPIQSPRIPIWVGGSWPNKKPFIRGSKFDGIIPFSNKDYYPGLVEMKKIINFISEYRDVKDNFDIVGFGKTPSDDLEKSKEIIREFADIGITWWTEDINFKTKEEVLERIKAGPPRI